MCEGGLGPLHVTPDLLGLLAWTVLLPAIARDIQREVTQGVSDAASLVDIAESVNTAKVGPASCNGIGINKLPSGTLKHLRCQYQVSLRTRHCQVMPRVLVHLWIEPEHKARVGMELRCPLFKSRHVRTQLEPQGLLRPFVSQRYHICELNDHHHRDSMELKPLVQNFEVA